MPEEGPEGPRYPSRVRNPPDFFRFPEGWQVADDDSSIESGWDADSTITSIASSGGSQELSALSETDKDWIASDPSEEEESDWSADASPEEEEEGDM